MRVEQIRFKNLSSLVGEWKIDFTHPAFVADGIFSITGPTGAGKTTVLDALCLALYGRTPRLNKVTKSENEIMSRQTGECFAEITFTTRSGRFRCHWSQRRAHKKSDGELQNPRHELAEADSGKILETRLAEVSKQIEKITGMDFARFTRSMLLAQGEFAAFLQAAADERAPILEQITGTEIYSRISIRVHETKTAARRKLDQLLTEFGGMQLLTEADEQQFHVELAQKIQQDSAFGNQISHERQTLLWLENIARLEAELKLIATQQQAWQIRKATFIPWNEQLDRANRALELAGEYSKLSSIRQEQGTDRSHLAACKEALSKQELVLSHAEHALKSTLEQLEQKQVRQQEAIPLIRHVRKLDIQLQEKEIPIQAADKAIAEQRKIYDALILQLQQSDVQLEKLRTTLTSLLPQFATIQTGAISWTESTEILKQSLAHSQNLLNRKQAECGQLLKNRSPAEWRQEISALSERKTQIIQAIETTQTLETAKQASNELEQHFTLLQNKKTQLTEQLKTQTVILTGFEKEVSLLETQALLLQKINSLEKARQQLQDDEPCPLCGALQHPYAAGNIPESDKNTIALQQARHALKTQNNTISELKIKLVETDKDIQQVVHEQQRNRQQILASETAMQQYTTSLLSTLSLAIPTTELLAQLSQLSLKTEDNLSRTAHILQSAEELTHEIGILRESLDTVKTLAQETEIRLVQRQHQTEQIQQCEETLKSQQIQSGQLRQEFTELHAKRLQLFADKQPDQEELLLARAVETAQKQVDNARQQLTAETQTANKLRNKAENLTNNMASRATGLAILEESFAIRLRQSAFADEAAFMAANLAEQERKQLAQQAQQLADEKIALNTKQQDKTVALEAERLKHMTDQPQNFHEQILAQLVTRQQALQQEIGGIQQKLKDNERIRQKQQEQLQIINAQKRECARWDLLHELIGSADGKKYRNFAQGLTFEVMIRHANRQLQKMSDRYFLIRDETRPLELNVIDNYQAGEIRSTKNLSGGESFIISLALALGLSHMVSHNIQVDSLFLDEGFGTLDEEALDTALETLASLQQQGKLIGIISHVAALQERISTRVQVIPQSGGRSRLSGPGCSHLQ